MAITAQNTRSVTGIEEVKAEMIKKQVDAVAQDLGVDAAKTGMLFSSPIISLVASETREYGFPLVVDPVMVSKSGAQLLMRSAVETLIDDLLPLATVVTPNAAEAGRLTGTRVRNLEDSREAAKMIVKEYGARAAVVKGGHLPDKESIDVLYHKGRFWEFRAPRIESANTHGTGCTFSSAITAELAKGADIPSAVRRAKLLVTHSIRYSLPIGSGHGPVNPLSWLSLPAEKQLVLESIKEGVDALESSAHVHRVAPEVQMNLAMALPALYVRGAEDVAGIPGRIVRVGDRVKATSPPAFGASSHLARAIIKVMEYDQDARAMANIAYSEGAVEAARSRGYDVSFYDRRKEPTASKAREGGTLPWVIERAILTAGRVPDVIYDRGDVGKEAMMRISGRNALDVAKKVLSIARGVKEA